MDFSFLALVACLALTSHTSLIIASTTEQQPRVISAENSQQTREQRKKVSHRDEPKLKYQPTWESLDTRPLPQWYDDAKVGT